jgi:hydrogenase-4 component F
LLPLLPEHAGTLLVPGSLASVLTGFVLLIGRTKAISQVCGYLILENGIYLFGLLLIHSTPLLVEAGILLDVTVGRLCHRHHRGPHPARVRFPRHPQTDRCANDPLLLIILPLAGAALAAAGPSDRTRPVAAAGGRRVALRPVLLAAAAPAGGGGRAWLGFDPLARAVLPVVSLLFLVCVRFYGVPYLAVRVRASQPGVRRHPAGGARPAQRRPHGAPSRVCSGSPPRGHPRRGPAAALQRTPRAFEATWKYLLVGGTGIALSLLGSFCLGYASLHGGGSGDLTFHALTAQGRRPLAAVVAHRVGADLLVGYGTKMGLAPMHTWKPDAYGEARGIVGAILAGGVTTVAFTALLRVRAVVGAGGEGAIADRTLLCHRSLLDGVAALIPARHPRFQAHARLLERRAHGHPQPRRRPRPAGIGAALFHVWATA